MIAIGDRVKYIGTKEQDVYHGALCGKVGTVEQVTPFILIKLEERMLGYGSGLFDAGPSDGSLVRKVD